MASRRDQLHSYQFMIQRVVAALVMRETDPAQSPFRRAAGAIFAGIMISAVIVAGFAVYGLWDPGGNIRFMTESKGKPVVVVEKETGATYVFMNGKLYPTLNYTSAMLIGGANHPPYNVSRDSLATSGVQVGPEIGIPGAPDSLPSQENLISGDWTLCAKPRLNAAGETKLETVMVVGDEPSPYKSFAGEGVLLVEGESGTKFLIYHSHRFPIDQETVVLQALSLRDRTPLKVGDAWLNGLPEGQEIKPLEIPGYGEPSSVAPDATVGTIYEVEGADTSYYVALQDQLASITEFQAAILETSKGIEPTKMQPGDASKQKQTTELMPDQQKLEAPPESAHVELEDPDPKLATCAIFGALGGKPPRMVYNGQLGQFEFAGVVTKQRGEDGDQLASRVVVPKGKGALVWTSEDPNDPTGGLLCLVTDTGKYYPLSDATEDMLKSLGYDPKKTAPGFMPTNLVERLDRGPTLDPEAAMQGPPSS